jgi:hypothetical protein
MKALVGTLLALCMSGSWAALGSGPAQFAANATATQTDTRSTGQAQYTDIRTTLASGTIVHEYADAAGTVFAVSWSGPFVPNLKQLLGPHFDLLAKRNGAGHARHGQRMVDQPDVVVESGGHMGAFEGRAWLPARLPTGFDPKEIQ